MKNEPYPEGWRPTWARLAIFLKPARGCYKLYAVGESSLEHGGERRIAAEGQPHHGFKTLADARRALAEADAAAALAKLRDCRDDPANAGPPEAFDDEFAPDERTDTLPYGDRTTTGPKSNIINLVVHSRYRGHQNRSREDAGTERARTA